MCAGNGHDFYENKSKDYSDHENQNQGTVGYKEDETETPQPQCTKKGHASRMFVNSSLINISSWNQLNIVIELI